MHGFLDRLNMRDMLAFLMVLAFMSLAFLLAVRQPESDIFKMLLGGLLSTGFAGIIAWYFGSSSGSAMKDEALAQTAASQTATIATQSAALASSVPAMTTTTAVDAGAGTAETVTEPADRK